MASLVRVDMLSNYKKETISILSLLHKLQPMLPKIAHLIFNGNGLEKPTQNLFNNITYYLLFLIDPQVHASLTWPLYDTKVERTFRSQLSNFISDYSAKGLITNVRPSYLVHPSCFKVSVLVYQLSVLAVKRMLMPRIAGTEEQIVFDDITDKYNSRSDSRSFVEYMDSFNYESNMYEALSNILCKKQQNEKICQMFRMKITEAESELATLNAQGYIDSLIDGFLAKHDLDETSKDVILQIKNINEPATFFDEWLREVDKQMDNIEANWENRALPLLEKCRYMQQLSEEIIKRNTGQIEKSYYTVEYDPKKDEICTDVLENQVNTSQKYILRNLQNNGRLNFPNLIRAFVISMCYILTNYTFGEEIYEFNERMDVGRQQYKEVWSAFRVLLERVHNAEKKLQPEPVTFNVQSVSIEERLLIPPLPDLSGLKMNQNQYNVNFDTFTPLNVSKHRFNLNKRGDVFTRPQPRSILPSFHAPKDDFFKTLLSCRVSSYDCVNTSQNCNMSVISNIKASETIGGHSGFSRQQITRLLSTNKKSSNKKLKNKHEHHNTVKIKGALFNDSTVSNDSHGLFRSYSSPNLFENRASKIPIRNIRGRKLSIMQENTSPQLDLSGITRLDSFNKTMALDNAESSRNTPNIAKNSDELKSRLDIQMEFENAISPILGQESHFSKAVSDNININERESQEICLSKTTTARELPIITITSIKQQETLPPKAVTSSRELHGSTVSVTSRNLPRNSNSPQDSLSKTVTPKTNAALIKKTSSLEKIINRFKQIRSNSIQLKDDDIKTIVEEKENLNTNIGCTANRNLLPDLLSPSCSLLNARPKSDPMGFDIDDVEYRNPRMSLGTMLGVDQTFLDQFDLID